MKSQMVTCHFSVFFAFFFPISSFAFSFPIARKYPSTGIWACWSVAWSIASNEKAKNLSGVIRGSLFFFFLSFFLNFLLNNCALCQFGVSPKVSPLSVPISLLREWSIVFSIQTGFKSGNLDEEVCTFRLHTYGSEWYGNTRSKLRTLFPNNSTTIRVKMNGKFRVLPLNLSTIRDRAGTHIRWEPKFVDHPILR